MVEICTKTGHRARLARLPALCPAYSAKSPPKSTFWGACFFGGRSKIEKIDKAGRGRGERWHGAGRGRGERCHGARAAGGRLAIGYWLGAAGGCHGARAAWGLGRK
jgi:hypothetical protein